MTTTQELPGLYKRKFGVPPVRMVEAPGRLELLGNHTDYNEGLVMALAVDRHIGIAASPRIDGQIELCSTAFDKHEIFYLDRLEKNPKAPWANYVKGVLEQLRKRGVHYSGFSALIHGTIPMGAGMGSSAALELATALMVRELYPYSLTDIGIATPPKRDAQGVLPPLTPAEKMPLAKLCQTAENIYVGVGCGLLDQISSLYGRAGHAVEIDCRNGSVEWTPLNGEFTVVVCNSGIKHALVSGEYNELRRHCEESAKALGVKSLRHLDLAQLQAGRDRLSERQYQCALHVVGENQRVAAGDRALRSGDLSQFGQYLYQSHESSRDNFHNSCKELDILVELARSHPACLGARLTGGGFGGATINLVPVDQAESFGKSVAEQYRQRTGHAIVPLRCRVVDGAH